ncbi:LysM peptidoglycan-binding domain-containing protein [Bacillus sp. MUM 13]|uniref:LysM peptidoglycan-binding domain-containing protein n=1 Tax=Bacillus sp. MUM 13 TaxID=1678001 RepID=UPI0008F5D89F|nr:LysM peptidoglycan-binding domain-containing protein [Bacillus sp. MUM 13]OIK12432.1 spore gernimation protein [Bacillus sp. MUM 13]
MKIHVVHEGDTLWHISQQYGVSASKIVEVNGLEYPDKLLIGMALLIPERYLTYKVMPGNTLYGIADYFSTTPQEILQINSLPSLSKVYPGQKLTIPAVFHRVKKADSIHKIAGMYGTSVKSLLQANNLSSSSGLSEGQIIKIPRKSKPRIEVNGFTNRYGQAGARDVREVAYDLTFVCPFAYLMRRDGSLGPLDDVPTVEAALSNGVVPIMSITNFSSSEAGTELAHTILSDRQLTEKLLVNILAVMKKKGYRGLNIDFENTAAKDRDFYNRFLKLAADKLHQEGYFVSSSLAPKTSSEQKGPLVEAHDYAAHGKILDFTVLMTYEWGYRKGPPQAISPLDQMKRVLDYAVTVMPGKKILMGFQLYARDWLIPHKEGQEAETFDMQEAIRRAVKHNAEIKYNPVAQSPYFNYQDSSGRSHEVWFEDARSAKAKFDLVKTYGLRGISYWVLGYPFPQNWALLSDTFIIEKR